MDFARTPSGWEANNAAVQMHACRLLGSLNVLKKIAQVDEPITFEACDLKSTFALLADEAERLLETSMSI